MRSHGSVLAGVALSVASVTARADPTAVVAVTTGDGPSLVGRVPAVGAVLGPDGLWGQALRNALGDTLGEPVPVADVLAGARAQANDTIQAYLAGTAGRAAGERLEAAVTAMDAAPLAQEARQDTHVTWLAALITLARLARENRQPAVADALLQRAALADPGWSPDARTVPPAVRAAHAVAVAAVQRGPHGTVTVVSSRAGCSTRVDGLTPVPGQRLSVELPAGAHRVVVACGDQGHRAHAVTVTPGAVVTVSVDPLLDAALDTTTGVALRLPSGADPTAVNQAVQSLGARADVPRVVAVTEHAVDVLDVSTGQVVVRVQDAAGLDEWRHGRTASVASVASVGTGQPSTVQRRHAHAGAAPWAVGAVGVAGLVAAGVFYGLRVAALQSAAQACPAGDGVLVCPAGTDPAVVQQARDQRDNARTDTLVAGVSVGVGAAALAGSALWLALQHREAPVQVAASPVPAGAVVAVTGRF